MMKIWKNKTPLIMGVVNITPDSFYPCSRMDSSKFIDNVEYQYADIIDVGCESSRPGASPVTEKKELSRLAKFLENGHHFTKILSIDTYKPKVARFALENGFTMINNIKSDGDNDLMLSLAAEYSCPIILMHMNGSPETMQKKPFYNDIMGELISFFETKIKQANAFGIKGENIILDPGIGFGKRVEDNDVILHNLKTLKQFNYPVLIGLSRKSFLSVNKDSPESRLPATIGATVLAIQRDVDILRVHDIEATYKLKIILERINNNQKSKGEIVYN